MWRGLGYTAEECTYISVSDATKLIEEVDKDREVERANTIVTRSKTRGDREVKLNSRFKDDIKDRIKERWLGVKGLDPEAQEFVPSDKEKAIEVEVSEKTSYSDAVRKECS